MSPINDDVGADARGARPLIDARFAKRLVLINGLIPLILLGWDASRHQLGANEVNFAIRTTGMVGLVLLTLALLITPLRKLTNWNTLIGVRRNLGVLGFFYIVIHFTIFWLLDRDGSITSTFGEIVTFTPPTAGAICNKDGRAKLSFTCGQLPGLNRPTSVP